MTTTRVRLPWLAVVLLVLFAFPAFASSVRIVRLSLAQGDVQIDRNSGDGWEQAINNMPVIGGARVYAAEGAKAELEFEDGSSVRLVGPAQISLLELSAAGDGSLKNQVEVDSGVVYANVRLHHHDDFRISVSSGESFVLTQPSKLRFTVDQQTASLAIMQGEAVAQDGANNSKIRSGETYNYVLGQPESAARLNNVPTQPGDSWDQQRDSYADQYSSSGAQNSGSDDPNAAGVADLGYYGTYSNLPGYGVAWRPSGFGIDWDPFAYGAWSYYPGWGWTFVSGYNWGWAPFYYGDWCYVGGRGWWWRPGPWHGRGGGGRGGGGGWHPQPRWTGGGPGRGWNGPRPPARAGRGTVAIAGSHLPVGPIGVTHGAAAGHGFVSGSGTNSSRTIAIPNGRPGATSSSIRGPARSNTLSNSSNSSIVGRRGSFSLSSPTGSRSGMGVHRPPVAYSPRAGSNSGAAVTHGAPGSSYAGASAPRTFTGPPTSIPRSPSAPVSSAPRVSSAPAGGGFSRSGGSGFSGGGGIHSGGGGSQGGGGSHGGGGHR